MNALKRSRSTDQIFEADEMTLRSIQPEWTVDELLKQEGIFYLKDIVRKLQLSTADFKKKAEELEQAGESPWETMGLRKAWTHWIVRMKRFGEFLNTHSMPFVREVEPEWDANLLLSQSGYFYLSDVCEKIPFSAHQIRFQIRRNRNAREEFGAWKDEGYKTYIVDMDRFSVWIRGLWEQAIVD